MLATMSSSNHDIPLREHSHLNIQHDSRESQGDFAIDDRLCPGCTKSAVSEHGGLVVAFGQSFFHVDCFKCAKCRKKVTADTNLLLLSDGSPICSNCSYCCNVCHLPILDEAIMAGDDSYHAHCFNCKVCKNRIDELVFAKTSQGIYCMNCHNERMIKIRKHAQKKAEREKAAGGSGSSKSRDRDAGHYHRENERSLSAMDPPEQPSTYKSSAPTFRDTNQGTVRGPERSSSIRSPAKQGSGPYVADAFEATGKTSPSNLATHLPPIPQGKLPPNASPSPSSSSFPTQPQPLSVTIARPPDSDYPPSNSSPLPQSLPPGSDPSSSLPITPMEHTRPVPAKNNTLPIPPPSPEEDPDGRRTSYDDGVRPLNILFKQRSDPVRNLNNNHEGSSNSDLGVSGGLKVFTSPRDKRRSINPGLVLSNFNQPVRSPASSPALSPTSAVFHGQQSALRPPTPPVRSPLREQSSESPPSSRRTSQTSSQRSSSSNFLSSSSSPTSPDGDQRQDQGTSSRLRSISSSTYLPEQAQDQTIVMRPPPRPGVTIDAVPPRMQSLNHAQPQSAQSLTNDLASTGQARLSHSLSPVNQTIRPQRSFDGRPRPATKNHRLSSAGSLNLDRSRSASRSGPESPSRWADVPHNVESGTDTDAEVESNSSRRSEAKDLPPTLPPKESQGGTPAGQETVDTTPSPISDFDPDLSTISRRDSSSDDMLESSPVEGTSHATFIAPALPPIRFSMNTADFSELFDSVEGGLPSLKSLGHLAKVSETHMDDDVPLTPPPSAGSFISLTPTNDTVFGSAPSDSTFRSSPHNKGDNKFDTTRTVDTRGRIPGGGRTTDGYVSPSTPSYYHTLPKTSKAYGNPSQHLSALDGYSSHESRIAPSLSASSSNSGHSSLESQYPTLLGSNTSISNFSDSTSSTRVTVTAASAKGAKMLRDDSSDIVLRRLQEAMADARDRGAHQLKLDKGFAEAILGAMESRKLEYGELRGKFDGIKRASKHYIDGLTVAQTEYDRELKARRDAEAEVTRLRVLLSGQAARLTALSADTRRQELRQQFSKELNENLSGLEHELSKLRVERDMTLAEVEELSASKSSGINTAELTSSNLIRSLTMRLDNVKKQYQHELVPLTQQREILAREVAELKAVRDVFLEETTVLNARNEELAQLSAQYARRMDTVPEMPSKDQTASLARSLDRSRSQRQPLQQAPTFHHSVSSSTIGSSTNSDETVDSKAVKVQKAEAEFPTPSSKGKFMKWPGSKPKEVVSSVVVSDSVNKGKVHLEHTFQQLSVLRFTRCDHCGDKMWGSQLRCSSCNISVHVRCINHVHVSCSQQTGAGREESQLAPLPPSMFGRDLTQQVRDDSNGSDRQVPVIVEKCIDAVEALALDYEGIYRKTGGSGQSKAITQLFERGDYSAFDLRDSDRFNDICSVTSVLKAYFRSLPIPLLTYDLHDHFMKAVEIRDPGVRNKSLLELVNKLPNEHYYTLRMLMLHLHHVRERCEKNLMNARNLGVVFGPTLMRSRDPSAEFSDMAGKALSVEWLVENAPFIFSQIASFN